LLFGNERSGIRGVDWGDLRAAIVAIPGGTNLAPLFQGLPDNRCPCPHWGYVLTGTMRVIYADGEETVSAGDLIYLPPGHTVVVEQDVEYLEFSPPAPHDEFMNVAKNNVSRQRQP
jgi:hypothetical protein